jgi:cephalosporin hydroxylase
MLVARQVMVKKMKGNDDFVRALAEYLAFHTEQSTAYFTGLIGSFLRGAQEVPKPDLSAKSRIVSRLKADMAPHNDVPSFLQNYLLTHLTHGAWPPQATFIASKYLERRPDERFVTWQRRRQDVAQLEAEPIRGTELGFRQMLYSQGAAEVFRWRGIPCFKSSYDIAIYAMLIDELRPGTIIELGSGAGASALLFADLCTSVGLNTQIISVDNAIGKISDPRITFVQSDCSIWLEATATSKRDLQRPCLIIEDFHGDLAGFFAHIDTILETGDYFIVEDSFPKQARISEVIVDRHYLIDSKYTDFFGVNCTSAVNSIFVKSTNASLSELRAQKDRELLRNQDRAWRQRNKRDT